MIADIPDHPVIASCEATGYPYGTPEWPHCPVCGDECSEIYRDHDGDVIGCDCCVLDETHAEDVECPVCHEAQAFRLYKTRDGKIVACDECMKISSAWDEPSCFSDKSDY